MYMFVCVWGVELCASMWCVFGKSFLISRFSLLQIFWLWCVNSVFHSILLYWMTVLALDQGNVKYIV